MRKTERSQADQAAGSTTAAPAKAALLDALDRYRAGMQDLHEAADEAGVASWDLLEAAQATPDPLARGIDEDRALRTFVRARD